MTDTILKCKGMESLTRSLGMVEAERFIALILREPFDYTVWQRDLYKDMSLDDFCQNVKKFREKNKKEI
ncbi:MAG: hypothetical protein Ta2F_00340 [Termitinemataceae bacterium]|nr:MAG: hypothetical protein Ta2F_00340 [Termitinemataceae bacterium]